ncbi:TPA: DUF3077 domain-containing protein, partial [Pseudomonas putida]|nr:DUF3077 domain-containing protein [Pseudomonas putida]
HALQQASELLASARRASFIGVMDDEPVLVWAVHYLSEMAKALMDDAHRGMHKAIEVEVERFRVVRPDLQLRIRITASDPLQTFEVTTKPRAIHPTPGKAFDTPRSVAPD